MWVTKPRSLAKLSTTVIPAQRRGSRADGDSSTPARAQCVSTTREPMSLPSRVHSPAVAPAWAAALALVTAPPQDTPNSSVKTSSPGPGSSARCPKTSSRNTEPNEIMSNRMLLTAAGDHGSQFGHGTVAEQLVRILS